MATNLTSKQQILISLKFFFFFRLLKMKSHRKKKLFQYLKQLKANYIERERVQISTLNNYQQTIHRNNAKTRRNLIAENNNNSNNKYAKSIVLKVSKRAENNVKY